ncbi:hypothetical protein RZO55_21115 [Clostridium boliviensis]|uniref:Uncharacterized protein n=1 Tax=Clostridium boliviensis TaxID=318465 RepID=A0ABU4GSW1_9CLOT|nr:hypothetical protein [Clostridium boliviensis]MDW2800077.1 hypothetical protein [Clostridium boliviensis]
MQDTIITVNQADPVRVFEALARIIGEKEGVEITLKSMREKYKKKDKKTGMADQMT